MSDVVEADSGVSLGAFLPGTLSVLDADSAAVWTGIDLAGGLFARRSLQGGPSVGEGMTDLSGARNFLSGRFYGAGGDEAGGVFRESLGWFENLLGAVGNPGAETVDEAGRAPVSLSGAFGVRRTGLLP